MGQNLEVSKNKNVYKVNLPKEVMEMIHEALHLEQMGYRISETVSNIALQRNHYVTNSRVLSTILENYYVIRRNLRPAEVHSSTEAFLHAEFSIFFNFPFYSSLVDWTNGKSN